MNIYDRPTPIVDSAEQPTDRIEGRYMVVRSDDARRLEQERDALKEALEQYAMVPTKQGDIARIALRAIEERK